jgi:hypothetical protein
MALLAMIILITKKIKKLCELIMKPTMDTKNTSSAIQFILSKAKITENESWSTKSLKEWTLRHHKSLPATEIYDIKNNHIGWMLGFFISYEGEYNSPRIILPIQEDSDYNLEKYLYSCCGRFACIIITAKKERVYLDSSGSFSVVYSTDHQMVASTSGLISDTLDRKLIDYMGMPNSGLYYPFGITAHKGVKRLLPNYYLNLKTFVAYRHFPNKDSIRPVEPEKAACTIAELIRRIIDSLARSNNICIPLTGGRDSRMLLACSRKVIDRVEFITIRSDEESIDSHIANILSKKFSLNHRFIYRRETVKDDLEKWLDIVGHAVSGFAWKDHSVYADFDYNRILLPGICGEIGRGFFYRYHDKADDRLDPINLLKRMKIPAHELFLQEAGKYIEELKIFKLDFFHILDFAYNEQRLGSWAGPSETGGDMFSVGKLWPMCHREIISNFINLPADLKKSGLIPEMVIECSWPDLLTVPFNSFTGPNRHILNFKSLVKRGPSWIIERLRAQKSFTPITNCLSSLFHKNFSS